MQLPGAPPLAHVVLVDSSPVALAGAFARRCAVAALMEALPGAQHEGRLT
jgi:hypothetical protein